MKHYPHALVIGGTGMLSEVSLWLNKKGYHVTVIGRHKKKYHELMHKAESPKQLSSILVDYHKCDELQEKLDQSMKDFGVYELVVAWIHSSAPDVIPTVMKVIPTQRHEKIDFFHVKGSQSFFEEDTTKASYNISYHEIFLGFKVIHNHSRWLSHKEIADGIIDSIQHRRKKTVVGQVEPWELRPN